MNKGATLIEILIVSSVLIILLFLSAAAFSVLTKKTELDSSIDSIISTLSVARNRTLASEEANQYGVYFDSSADPDRYIFFKGENYISRDIAFDEIHELPFSVEIASTNFNSGGEEIVFNRLEGDTDNYGFFVIHSLSTNEIRNIYIYSSGEISFQPELISGFGRISDSRHVHFDLGWSISGAETLEFDFFNAGQVEQISMAEFFSSTSFEWEGIFMVNNIPQRFTIHTHQLDPITLLCIHRDRNNGENNEEVYIYIIQDSINKEIVHYDDDQNATAYKGIYVWNEMEIQ